ncbi:acyltransferase family protein [Vibrio sp. TRT 1302]|uniref:acyltransferase family protein n=1 Tax=Vibrio sp. TRT 1302 TaxID=3418504 RepID=UPI003CEF8231
MTKLSEHLNTRDNNFNLIRMLAALAVIFSHSFILANGPKNGADPLASFIGMPVSGLAVNIFFITSGMLVTKSLLDRDSVVYFLVARALRIFPGLIVAVLFSAFIVGSIATKLNLQDYLLHSDTLSFVSRNIWLFDNVIQYSLPAVFDNIPYKHAVNGSLWTLPWEIYAYASILIVYIVARQYKQLVLYIVALFLFSLNVNNAYGFFDVELLHPVYLKLLVMFYTGVIFYLLKDWVIVSWPVLFISVILCFIISDYKIYKVISPFFLTYWTICFAYLIKGWVLRYNRLGDLSYGAYIYAFPIQQILVYFFSPTGWDLFFASTATTLVFAYFSWNVIEKRCMKYRDSCIELISEYWAPLSDYFCRIKRKNNAR